MGKDSFCAPLAGPTFVMGQNPIQNNLEVELTKTQITWDPPTSPNEPMGCGDLGWNGRQRLDEYVGSHCVKNTTKMLLHRETPHK